MADDSAPRRSRISLRRCAAVALWASLALAAALAVGVLAIQAGVGRERVRAGLESLLASSLDQPVSIGELSGPLWPELELRRVRIGPADAPSFEADAVILAIGSPTFEPVLAWRIAAVRILSPVVRGPLATLERAPEEPAPNVGSRLARHVEITVGVLDVVDGRLDWTLDSGQRIHLAGRIALRNVPLHRGLAGMTRSRGEIDLEWVEGPDASPLVQRGRAVGRLRRGTLHVEALELAGTAGRLSGDGTLELAAWAVQDPRAELRLEVEVSDLDLGAATGRPALSSTLAGHAEVRLHGPGPSWLPEGGELEIELRGGTSRLRALDVVHARTRWQKRNGRLETFVLRGPGLHVDASGGVADGRLESLDLAADLADLSRVAAFLPAAPSLSGSLSARAALAGPPDALTGSVQLDGEGVAIGSMAWDRVAASLRAVGQEGFAVETLQLEGELPVTAEPGARIRLQEGGIVIAGLQIRSKATHVGVEGRIDEKRFRDLAVRVSGLEPGGLPEQWAVPDWLTGRFDGELTFDGPHAAPRVVGDVHWLAAVASGLPADDVRLRISPDQERHRVEAQVQLAGRPWLRGHVTLPRNIPQEGIASLLPALRFHAVLDGMEIATLSVLVPPEFTELEGSLSGEVDGRFERGEPIPLVDGRLELVGGGASLPEMESRLQAMHGAFTLAGRQVHVKPLGFDWVLADASDRAHVEAEGRLDREGFLDVFSVRSERVDAGLLGRVLSSAVPIAGPIRAELRLSGPYRAPLLEGEIDWREPVIGDVRAESMRLSALAEGARLLIEGGLRVEGDAVLRVDGHLPRDLGLREPALREAVLRSGDLDISLEADRLDLSVLAPLARGWVRDPRGVASGRVQLRGTPDGPQVSGALGFREGSLRVPLLATTFEPISGQLTLDGESLHVDELRIQADGGDLRLSGDVRHQDRLAVATDLSLVADNFPLQRRGLLTTRLSGQARLTGPAEALVLEGRAVLAELDVKVPRPEDPAAREIRILSEPTTAQPDEPAVLPGAFEALAARVRVDVPATGRIHGLGADLQVEGDLEISKQPGVPATYAGGLRVIRGRYVVEGRSFEVIRGVARLDGSSEVDPLLDVEASHPVRDVTILARLSGRLSDPIAKLTSEPSMPDDDVLSYLLFGRPASQLTDAGQNLVGGAAAHLASGLATSRLGELTKGLLHVDTVDVTTNVDGVPVLGIGKTLNERTFVRIGKSLGVRAEDEIQVEVKLTPQISVQSEITTKGDAGGDVIWKLDY